MARSRTEAPPPRRRYAKRLLPADRREQLLDTALRIVTTAGFAEVTIAAVAEHGGVTRPVVYDSFGNRDELLAALIERETSRMRAAVGRALLAEPESGTRAREVLLAALGRFLSDVRTMPGTWRLVYFPIDGVPPLLRDHIRKARNEFRVPLRQLLGDWLAGRPPGERADEVDLDVFVELVQGCLQTLSRRVLDDPEQFGVERIIAAIDLMLGELP
ncbi:TetR/AcrR family transcriptional regulator [Nocardia sp. XZ_19_385]|uniref:TetR/AcrR family transcriptional regulator n=1 Tax=Nocardia sp. XZ_19_385 TaxID=2769488 RepID=UPI00188F7AED|nr:TetR/AcrR family transcriptional regulator [Nocardia sp. XZ_19_385]